MKVTLDDLKRAYKSHIRRCVPSSRKECPSAESIFAIFDDSVSLPDKEKIIDHITRCCYCLQEFELHLDFYRKREKAINELAARWQSGESGSKIPSRGFGTSNVPLSSGLRIRLSWRLAIASLFAIGIVVITLVGIRSFFKTQETWERGSLYGQIRLIFPIHGEKVSIPLVFQWEGDSTVEYYHLEIFDKSLLSVWKSPRVEGFCYKLPPEAIEIIKRGESYFWMITARLTDGTKKESGLEEFTIGE